MLQGVGTVVVALIVTIRISDGQERTCKLSKGDICNIMQCNDLNGKLYIGTSTASEGSVCFFRCANETFSVWKKCVNGRWEVIKRNGDGNSGGIPKPLSRVKRGFWGAIGNFFKCIFTFGFLCGGRDRDTVPPSLHCPPDKWTLSDDIQTNARVYWTEPTARDDRDGNVRVHRNGPEPGLSFSEGTTVIGYYARDNSGNMARCSLSIVVEVPRCKNLPGIQDGYSICLPSYDMVKGTVCRFGCYHGHKLVGDSSTRCTEYGSWTKSVPICKRRKCEPPLTSTGDTSVQCSDSNFYRSKCSYTCEEGFDVMPGMTRVRVCTKDGTWRGREPKCIDVTRPVITNCTKTVYGFADRGTTSGVVHWTEPLVYDNADRTIQTQRSGPASDDRLEAGTYDVTYTATDKTGNKAIPCTIKVIVKVLRCPAINNLPHQTVNCPDGYKYGSQCNFICANGSLINGTGIATCEKGSTGLYASWRWGNYQPFCKVVQLCEDDLQPPDNGAVACDYWLGGKFCQMLCKNGYDVPPGSLYSEMYVCGETGKWLPGSALPNCAKIFKSQTSALRMDVNYYFDGDCNDADVLRSIKVKFIRALMASSFKDACEVYAEKCQPGNVQIRKFAEKHKTSRVLCLALIKDTYCYEGDETLKAKFAEDATVFAKFKDAIHAPPITQGPAATSVEIPLKDALTKDCGHMDVHEMRSILTTICGPKNTLSTKADRRNWFRPENMPVWWQDTGLPFISINHPKGGEKKFGREQLCQLIRACQQHHGINTAQESSAPIPSSTTATTSVSSVASSSGLAQSVTSAAVHTSSSVPLSSTQSSTPVPVCTHSSASVPTPDLVFNSNPVQSSTSVNSTSISASINSSSCPDSAPYSSSTCISTPSLTSVSAPSSSTLLRKKFYIEHLLEDEDKTETFEKVMRLVGSSRDWSEFCILCDEVKELLPDVPSTLCSAWKTPKLLETNPLYKPHIPLSIGRRTCLATKADGNCVYNSISLCLYGDEDHASFLRLASVVHMASKVTDYSKYIYEEFKGSTAEWVAAIAKADFAVPQDLSSGEIVEKICMEEMMSTLENPYRDCSLFHLHMVANMLKRPIVNHFGNKTMLGLPLGENLFPPLSDVMHPSALHLVWVPTKPSRYATLSHVVPAVCSLGHYGTHVDECAFEGLQCCTFMHGANNNIKNPNWIECSSCGQWIHDICIRMDASTIKEEDLFLCGCQNLQADGRIKLKRVCCLMMYHL